jgi:hypothetical protein
MAKRKNRADRKQLRERAARAEERGLPQAPAQLEAQRRSTQKRVEGRRGSGLGGSTSEGARRQRAGGGFVAPWKVGVSVVVALLLVYLVSERRKDELLDDESEPSAASTAELSTASVVPPGAPEAVPRSDGSVGEGEAVATTSSITLTAPDELTPSTESAERLPNSELDPASSKEGTPGEGATRSSSRPTSARPTTERSTTLPIPPKSNLVVTPTAQLPARPSVPTVVSPVVAPVTNPLVTPQSSAASSSPKAPKPAVSASPTASQLPSVATPRVPSAPVPPTMPSSPSESAAPKP